MNAIKMSIACGDTGHAAHSKIPLTTERIKGVNRFK
jgi:hypothetical protein